MGTGVDRSSQEWPLVPGTRWRYVVLLGFCLAAATAYIPRNSISAAESSIRKELSLTKKQTRWIIIGFFITYAGMQIPTGQLGHAWGTRRSLMGFAGLGSLGVAGFALSPTMGALVGSRMLMGTAQAGYFPCITGSVGRWFPKRQQAFASGWIGSSMSIGGAVGVALTGLLLQEWSWRWVFLLYTFPGLLWAVWFWRIFRDRPQDHPRVNAGERELICGPELDSDRPLPVRDNRVSTRTVWLNIICNRSMWGICGQQFCRGAGYMFYASWFATYLQESRGVSISRSAVLNSLPLILSVFGCLIGGWVSDKVLQVTGSLAWARRGLSVVSMLSCAALIAIAFFVEDATLAVVLISCGAFCASFAGPCAYTATIDMGGAHVAQVFSTMNMAGNVGAVAFPFIVPELIEWSGNWDLVLFLFCGLYVAAAVCWLAVRPQQLVVRDPRVEGG